MSREEDAIDVHGQAECRTASIASAARLARYRSVDLSGIEVRCATTDEDFRTVASLRSSGFSRGRPRADDNETWVDEADFGAGAFSLIGSIGGCAPIATLRVQDGRVDRLEIEKFVDYTAFVPATLLPCVQFARLSIARSPRGADVMFALFKAAWRWSFREELQSIIIATPKWALPIYEFMLFRELGENSRFRHPFARDLMHYAMLLPVMSAEAIWRSHSHPLCDQFFELEHERLGIRRPCK